MISYIQGEVSAVEKNKAVIDVHGVGYGIFMPASAIADLPPKGSGVKVYTYLNVREDAVQLFGFLSKDELDLFRLIIAVSGIGPKGALMILSVLTADELRRAVLSGDVKAITAAPGVGRKTAEKLILELKDKFHVEDLLPKGEGEGERTNVPIGETGLCGAKNDAVQALMVLGYGYVESVKAVKTVNLENPTVEQILKEALKNMF